MESRPITGTAAAVPVFPFPAASIVISQPANNDWNTVCQEWTKCLRIIQKRTLDFFSTLWYSVLSTQGY